MTPNHVRVSEQIDRQFTKAQALLVNGPLSSEQVHELRTTCKRLRGLLRLYRKADKKRLRSMAGTLREVAGEFSVARDVDVLQAHIAQWFRAQKHASLRQYLLTRLEQKAFRQPPVPLSVLRKKMLVVQREWQALAEVSSAVNIDEALQRSRLKAQKAGRRSLKSSTPEGLHTWRKRVKDHYYQWDAIAITPAQLRRRMQLKRLGSLLGDIHDLDVLLDFLNEARTEAASQVVIQRIERQRERLLLRVEVIATRLQGSAS